MNDGLVNRLSLAAIGQVGIKCYSQILFRFWLFCIALVTKTNKKSTTNQNNPLDIASEDHPMYFCVNEFHTFENRP